MDGLTEARQTIEECDREMAALFEKRMAAVREIALYKKERGLPVYVPEREQELLLKNSALIRDPAVLKYYRQFLQEVMDVSKQYQEALISGTEARNGEIRQGSGGEEIS
ncbi:MAG: chorismate mutase [Lachnospiraceae bacterium]|nr:chorismate mutase [Lachnospiraceae bacterium]